MPVQYLSGLSTATKPYGNFSAAVKASYAGSEFYETDTGSTYSFNGINWTLKSTAKKESYTGLSTDTKPTYSDKTSAVKLKYLGSEFYEIDTGKIFIYDGSSGWSEEKKYYRNVDESGLIASESGIARTVLRAFGNFTSSGPNQLVAGVSTKKIRVVHYSIITSSAANNVKFTSNSTDISATKPFAANAGQDSSFNWHGFFETAAGEALNINLSATAPAPGVACEVIYITI